MDNKLVEIQKALEEHYGNTPVMFLKFAKKVEYLEDIRQGSLYMNNINYFVELGKNSNEAGVGDRYEAAYLLGETDVSFFDNEKDDFKVDMVGEDTHLRSAGVLYRPLFCLYAVTVDMLKAVAIEGDKVRCVLTYTHDELESLKKAFGEYVLFIMAQPFYNNVKKSFGEKQYAAKGKMAVYQDYSIQNEKRFKDHVENNPDLFFYKDKAFAFQKEYRLVITNKHEEHAIKEQIGSLEKDSAIFDVNLLKSDKGIAARFYLPQNYQ